MKHKVIKVSINPLGNLGNRMIKYMAAMKAVNCLGRKIEFNCELPEFGMHFISTSVNLQSSRNVATIRDYELKPDHKIFSDPASFDDIDEIYFDGYFQRISLFEGYDFYRDIFPVDMESIIPLEENEILINVRAGEIIYGNKYYPLVPVNFYQELVESTGLSPVFYGQIDGSEYVSTIRKSFPNAKMIPSAGPMKDFNVIRNAKKLCLAVSTFSWLAGWLSDAVEIHLPLIGFMHPKAFPPGFHGLGGIDLTPRDDPRFCFHLLPKIHGAPEREYLKYTGNLSCISAQISSEMTRIISDSMGVYHPRDLNKPFDEDWYLREYLDAAWDISYGWHRDAFSHYCDIGRLRGHLPHRPLEVPRSPIISTMKNARQSSRAEISIGHSIVEDAMRAVDGNHQKDNGFLTNREPQPWWEVDLGAVYEIECIEVYNSRSDEFKRRLAVPFDIYTSGDGINWINTYQLDEDFEFGCEIGYNVPFQIYFQHPVKSRYIKIVCRKNDAILSLASVVIYGS